jgi:ABC-type dipeptide/oligopeptide/nickel transport system ATPase component
MSTSRPLLEVHNLTVRFPMHEVVAVDRLSFQIARGERVALVGGSGSGKSATALALIGLSDAAAVVEASSRIVFDGHELPALEDESSDTLRTLRGNRIAMIFQDPAAALNPSMSVRDQIAETALVHGVSPAVALRDADVMLARVGLHSALGHAYAHELSGGQCQRAMIAMALLLRPALIIADEPTSSLDVIAQAQVLTVLRDLQRETGAALLLITHDLGVVATTCTRVLVMHAGQLVEDAPVERLFRAPEHPVSVALIRAVPRLAVRR